MRAALVALVVLLLASPLAAAQVPTPEEVVTLACGTAGGVDPDVREAIPLCPRQDPAGPAEAAEDEEAADEHDHGADPAEPQEAAREISDEAADAAQGSAQDPQSAPGRAAGLMATIRQAIEDLLGLPGIAGDALAGLGVGIAAGFTDAATNVRDATVGAFESATAAVTGAIRGAGRAVVDAAHGAAASTTDAAAATSGAIADAARTITDAAGRALESALRIFHEPEVQRRPVPPTQFESDVATQTRSILDEFGRPLR